MLTKIEIYAINKAILLRKKYRMSQHELACLMNVSTGFIGKVESKQQSSKYNLNHIATLSKIFNVPPNYFLPDKEDFYD